MVLETKVITLERKTIKRVLLIVGIIIFAAIVCLSFNNLRYLFYKSSTHFQKLPPSTVEQIPLEKRTTADLVLLGARQEAQNQTRYDGSYQVIGYPGGDVSPEVGACTDVVIRAFRNAGIDLQTSIHEDMLHNFNAYPQKWGLQEPDPNIDHRRIPNQMKFFERHGTALNLSVDETAEWQWGDIVYCKFQNGDEHCGIISDRRRSDDVPLVIHNAGMAVEQDCLGKWEIIGHYRYNDKI